jgi:phenylglyoxylate dehydrogenase epsilon subunit
MHISARREVLCQTEGAVEARHRAESPARRAQRGELADGSEIAYEKILLATGAAPAIPPIPGLDQVSYHVLRTLDDATKLNAAIKNSKQAVVLGAGLVGMHAAENLVKAGASVTIVEMAKQLTDGYFDAIAAGLIEKAFTDNGARILTGSRVVKLAPSSTGATLTLENGTTLEADLLLVATGVKPNMEYLAGSRVEHDRGILVSDTMQTSVANVWSAGDCAQAKGFYTDAKIMNAILPDATEQGRIAGMAMAERSRTEEISRRRAAQHLPLLRPPCDFRRQQQGARGRRDGDPVRRSQRPLPEGDFQCRQPADGDLRRQ